MSEQPQNLDHRTTDGFFCPVTKKQTDYAWTDRSKPGLANSCYHCTGDPRTAASQLHKLNKEREANQDK